ILFGHGPVFRDFNFAKDDGAAAEVLTLGLPMTLVPYEAARTVMLTGGDLAQLEAAGGASAWVATRARGWLGFWAEGVGSGGFLPLHLLPAPAVWAPPLCDGPEAPAGGAKARRLGGGFLSPGALLVGRKSGRPETPRGGGRVIYCPRTATNIHAWLMA